MQPNPKATVLNRFFFLIFFISLIVSGCMHPSVRSHPEFQRYRQPMGAMLVLLPEIRIFQQLPDGSRLFQDIQSQEAQRNAQAAIIKQLRERHVKVRTTAIQLPQQEEYQCITYLYRSVNRSIQLHTFGPQIFPVKLSTFEYSVGSVADMLTACGADGLVMAIGHQTGSDQPDSNWFSIAVVEPEGRIIWYGLQGNPHQFNLQNAKSVSALVAATMDSFWEQGS